MFDFLRKCTRIADLKSGQNAVIRGKVECPKALFLSETKMNCVYYDILIETYKKGARGRGRPLWFPEGARRDSVGFFVVDDTGKVWIEDTTDNLVVIGGYTVGGRLDRKGKTRYSARLIREGDDVKVAGISAGEVPGDTNSRLTIHPNKKGLLKIRVRPFLPSR